MKFVNKKHIYFIFFSLFLLSCKDNRFLEFETQIRNDFKDKLKLLPDIDYIDLKGRVPNQKEIELGRLLFNDTILSRNNDVSCATCHLSNHGFADGNSLSIGALGSGGPAGESVGKSFAKGDLSLVRGFGDDGLGFLGQSKMFRNTLSTINVAYRMKKDNSDGLFHDGRFGSLFFQALLPIHTSIEMCGDNPIPIKDNPFVEGGALFKKPVIISHANSYDLFEGRELGQFNSSKIEVTGVPSYRPNGTQSIPGRNECLAIAIAKIRSVPEYRKLFKEVYDSEVSDLLTASALGTFLLTHVSKNTPYDKFVKGESSLSENQLEGMVSFFTPLGDEYTFKDKKIKGAGCFKCHNAPTFGGEGFASLGVRGDSFSSLAKAENTSVSTGAFFGRVRLQRGVDPGCHLSDSTVSPDGYAPDIGRAQATFKSDDCFKFRVPVLRNIIETYPYFHHGTARAQGSAELDLTKRSLEALGEVVKYHLRGPVDPKLFSVDQSSKVFYDEFHQKDFYVPFFRQNFISLDPEDPQHKNALNLFPAKLNNEDVEKIVDFIANGLFDSKATQIGDLGNDVSHPKKVPSGLKPTITRDFGTQLELPPNSDL